MITVLRFTFAILRVLVTGAIYYGVVFGGVILGLVVAIALVKAIWYAV